MDRTEALNLFIKANFRFLLSEKFLKSVYKRVKLDFFLDRHKNIVGVPKDKAETIVKNLSEIDKSKALKDAAFLQDICKTPTTPGPIPIPYPNTAMASDTTSGSKSVKISGKEVMLKNKSYYEKSTGDEAGTSSAIDGIEIENVVKQLRSGLEQLYVNIDDAINVL